MSGLRRNVSYQNFNSTYGSEAAHPRGRPWGRILSVTSAVVVVACVSFVLVRSSAPAPQGSASRMTGTALRHSGIRLRDVKDGQGYRPLVQFQPQVLPMADPSSRVDPYQRGRRPYPEAPSMRQTPQMNPAFSRRDMMKYGVASIAAAVVAPNVVEAIPFQCPGAPGGVMLHASASVSLSTDSSCADVQAEIKARADPKSGWIDPHNKGTYALVAEQSGKTGPGSVDDGVGTDNSKLGGMSGASGGTAIVPSSLRFSTLTRLTGDGQFTDKMTFTFADTSAGGCQVAACSDSQVNSLFDDSTNYCNLRNLYCGTADGCNPVTKDIAYKEELGKFSKGAGKDTSKCIQPAKGLA